MSFIGWYLLLIPAAVLPGGAFAQLFLQPYVQTACAAFYEDIKNTWPAEAPCRGSLRGEIWYNTQKQSEMRLQ